MTLFRLIAREFVGLFVDDERLALSILAVVAACGLVIWWFHAGHLAVALMLVLGCAGVLLSSVVKGAAK
ncbi:hypothetical protein [Bosea sp. 685]|uniref:hypothetical protein n=1 Tax=Bosea sp. 685 TaxID=3080057 RepID=UPI002892C3D0|nr:hypothetical protein [Bosea sp. 685]WNJ87978.1 hypothetical protein RMR04_00060 [Bosea sp. 685]